MGLPLTPASCFRCNLPRVSVSQPAKATAFQSLPGVPLSIFRAFFEADLAIHLPFPPQTSDHHQSDFRIVALAYLLSRSRSL